MKGVGRMMRMMARTGAVGGRRVRGRAWWAMIECVVGVGRVSSSAGQTTIYPSSSLNAFFLFWLLVWL